MKDKCTNCYTEAVEENIGRDRSDIYRLFAHLAIVYSFHLAMFDLIIG